MSFKIKGRAWCIIGVVCLSWIGSLGAEEPWYPHVPEGYVNDYTQTLSQQTIQTINSLAQVLRDKTTAQYAVVIVKTTKPVVIEEYAVTLFKQWGLGEKGKDNGVLLVIAVADRTLRIETGYGLEGALPDAMCARIIQQVIVPYFKSGDMDKGVLEGTQAILGLVAKEYKTTLEGLSEQNPLEETDKADSGTILFAVVLVLFVIIVIINAARKGGSGSGMTGRGSHRGWYGSSGGFGSGGGFGGFGGGFSGGGGASGRW